MPQPPNYSRPFSLDTAIEILGCPRLAKDALMTQHSKELLDAAVEVIGKAETLGPSTYTVPFSALERLAMAISASKCAS